MADAATPIAPRIRSLFPDLELYSPSPPPLSDSLSQNHHFTVPRLRRGPMYSAYSELRESKLRKKKDGCVPLGLATKTPPKPQKKAATAPAVAHSIPDLSAVLRKENRNPAGWASPVQPKASKMAATPPRPSPPKPQKKAATAPAEARSIPDLSAVLRKENRNPAGWASPVPPKASKMAATPPRPSPATVAASSKGGVGAPRRAAGSASANGRDEKGCGGSAVRKSYACLRELKGLSGVASSAIEEEGRAPVGGSGAAKRLARRYY